METIKFLGLLCATWLFTEGAGPIQFLKRLLEIRANDTPKSLFKQVVRELVNCALCSGFWIGLIFYSFSGYEHWILMACLTSVAAELFARTISYIFNNILNKL